MAGAFIECYAYSEGPATSTSTAAMQTVQTLAIFKASSGLTYHARPAAPQRWTDLLATWAAALSAASGLAIGVTYSATAHRLTVTGSAAIRPVMVGNGSTFTGFTQALAGTSTSWTADAAPTGRADLLGAMVEPADDWTHLELAQYSHGRTRATAWGNHQVHKVTLYATGDAIAAIQQGYLQAGRVRVYQGDDVDELSAYSATSPTGYIDGWVIGCGQPVEESVNLWTWPMLIGVSR